MADIDAKAEEIFAVLRAAETKAPDNGDTPAQIAAGVSADQIERAVSMYAQATTTEQYAPYLDGYGFYKTAKAGFDRSSEAILADDPDAHARISAALELLASAYPSVERPATLDVDQGALLGASSAVMLAVN